MQQIVFDDWTLNPASGELSRDGTTTRLQAQSLQVLLALLEKPGEVVTREELIGRLWPKVVVDYDTSLKAIVRKLRLALGDAAERPRYIETLPRTGYRFIGTLRDGERAGPKTALAQPPRRPQRLAIAGAAVGAALLALIALVTLTSSFAPEPHVRLGVLPFRNLSPDRDNAFFADGLYEEVLTALASATTEMDVLSSTTMTAYAARQHSAPDLRRELGVTHVLEGSVRREGTDVRVTMQLIDTSRDRHVWAQNFDRTLGNATMLQAEVAGAVAAQLGVRLSNHTARSPETENLAARDLYLQALIAMKSVDQRTPLEEIERALKSVSDAIELDESYAAAYALRAQILLLKYVLNHDLTDANRDDALRDIERARQLGGNAVAVLQASSRYSALFGPGPDYAIGLLDTPDVAASSQSELLRWRAFFLCRAGRTAEGLAAYARAVSLDPANPAIVGAYVAELWALRQPLVALEVVRAFNDRGSGRIGFGDLEFAFTGNTQRLRDDIENAGSTMAADNRLLARFDLLRFEERWPELAEFGSALDTSTVRLGGFREYGLPGTGTKPVAELRGWVNLLNGDAAAAVEDGHAVQAFVDAQLPTGHNAWHRRMLAATGALFRGERSRAITDAEEALRITPPQFDFVRLYSMLLAARVFAWAGAGDRAMDILDALAVRYPGLGPAEIAREPLYARPLADNPRYVTLKQNLESEIESNRTLFAEQLR